MDDERRTPAAPSSRDELLKRAASYATTVPLDIDHAAVDWECSERARRRAGACLFDRVTEQITIRLTWAAYRAYGWSSFTGVIRHELVHAWEYQQFGDSDHGSRFRRVADALDAPVRCPAFATPRVRLVCRRDGCPWSVGRYRASATVTNPEDRRCGACGSRYRVEHVETGATWTTRDGYERTRAALGDQW